MARWQAEALIAEEEASREKREKGSKGSNGSKSAKAQRRAVNKSLLLPDPPPVSDRCTAWSAHIHIYTYIYIYIYICMYI